ncbi:low molecular weight protein-tyrosine-phosphatase [Intrasporangium sp.]|uniref:low molecular weight protein-tyrosine-phosphatase n=1 Tax=Intrasporangium sp. TaxID=1925024 RepID=UPI003221E4F3
MAAGTVHVTFVCTGNICRSPMGEVILTGLVERAGLADRVRITSSGTGGWHVGNPADPRTIDVLEQHGYDGTTHRARQFERRTFDEVDLVLAADRGHVRTLHQLAHTDVDRAKIHLVREFDPAAVAAGTLETDDPWYGGEAEFARCFREVEAACRGILARLEERLG